MAVRDVELAVLGDWILLQTAQDALRAGELGVNWKVGRRRAIQESRD